LNAPQASGPSVKIRLGKRERVFDQFDPWFCLVYDDDLDNVEPEKNIGIIEHSKPRQGAARNAFSFVTINRFHGSAEIIASAGFHFHKNQRVLMTTDNIDLTASTTAKIAEEDLVTVTLQIAAR
jgi:hypothetical protein